LLTQFQDRPLLFTIPRVSKLPASLIELPMKKFDSRKMNWALLKGGLAADRPQREP
jgi:hypothetical protein